jgi:hypothetical protein
MNIEILKPFDVSKLNIISDKFPIYTICQRIKRSEIDLEPDFQRKRDLWNDQAKSQLIESILIGIPLPFFYFDATKYDNWVIIDGLQRLSTFKAFVVDKTLKLTGLEFLTELNGNSFDDLDGRLRRNIEETTINAYLLKSPTPEEAKFNIFKRINTGGLVLTTQEKRNAKYPGNAQKFLKTLSEFEVFRNIVYGKHQEPERMEDRELCLRYVAFIHYTGEKEKYVKNVDEFLDDVTVWLNSLVEEVLSDIENNFYSDINFCNELFGKKAFRKLHKKNDKIYRRSVNAGLYQAWLSIIHSLDKEQRLKIKKMKNEIINSFADLCSNEEFSKIRSTDYASTENYIKLIKGSIKCLQILN